MKPHIRRTLMPLSLFAVAIVAAMMTLSQTAHAQVPDTILYNFDTSGTDGYTPAGRLLIDSSGDLLGITAAGGANGAGTVFSYNPDSDMNSILYNFGSSPTDGTAPAAGLLAGANGVYYGTTYRGGVYDDGTVYEVTAGGTYQILYSFGKAATDGFFPESELVEDANGKLYGTTYGGGAYGEGTVFKVTTSGGFATLYSFGVNDNDGENPNALLRAANGNFYGNTQAGGVYGAGTLFELTSSGAYSKLYDFGTLPNDGALPYAGLFEDTNGNLYGVTVQGGDSNYGTVFKYSSNGEVSLLHSFGSSASDGNEPDSTLIQASDGNLYGTAIYGGVYDAGVIYRLTESGILQNLHSFGPYYTGDGLYPGGALTQGANNTLYGTTEEGGANNVGTIYSIPSNYPFVLSFTPASGPVGTVVTITGTSFSGTSAVSFGTVAANPNTFTVSSTQVTATVPVGAKSGVISITTPAGTFSSLNYFYVSNPAVPTISSFTPTSGPIGASVTITGTGFTGATLVKFNATAAATFTVVSATSITATVPSGATTGKISVTTPGGTATSSSSFTVTTVSAPTITSFTPTSGTVGSSVTITGTNFTGASAVKFNGTSATTFTVVSATSIKATVPTGATTGKISVTTAGGTATSTGTFTVTAATAPTITSFTPTSGPVKTDVSITGTNFTGATSVTFNGVAATTFNVDSSTLIKALVPAGATTGVIKVTTPSGTGTSTASFTVN